MNLVFLGIQGSGKGTQSKIIADRYNLKIFETGAECRHLATLDSELGHKVREIVDSGNLVSADIVMEIVNNFLSHTDPKQSVIFDGVPRNHEQQDSFDQMMKKWNRDFLAINLQLPEEETIKRLLSRNRHDDKPEIITNRIKIFIRDTAPIIASYREQNKTVDIDANQSIEKVAEQIESKLDPYFLK